MMIAMNKWKITSKGYVQSAEKQTEHFEIYISKKNFEDINLSRKEKGLELFQNCRNLAAGTIRQLDPSVDASRKFDCCL